MRLVCVECGLQSEHGIGWRAELAADENTEDPELLTYCPECWEREFGDDDEASAE
jgi:hypothetical protein